MAWRLPSRAFRAGTLAACLAAVLIGMLPASLTEAAHERIIDTLLVHAAAFRRAEVPAARVVVFDIDTRSLAALGPWPWPRRRVAALVDGAKRGGAAVVAMDILFEGPDAKSPATLARRLGAQTARPDLLAWAETLEDGDRLLGDALADVPAVLGFALDPNGAAPVPAVPFLTTGTVSLSRLWRVGGAIIPYEALLARTAGLGVLAMPGDEDGLVRRVPLVVGVGGQVRPGLAAEALRLAQGASAYRIDGDAGTIAIGGVVVPLPSDGMLRLVPGQAAQTAVSVVSASDVASRAASGAEWRGAIVLIGGSAPELGGLRPSSGEPLMPSVMLHAAALAQLSRGIVPRSLAGGVALAAALGLLATATGLLAAVLFRPVRGAMLVALLAALLIGAALVGAAHDGLFDPSVPIVLGVAAFATSTLVRAAETQRREARIRQRFAQHLAPAVVERIAANPSALKLAGERREVTALFTDVEGFTALTRAAGPETLIAMLDEYFEGVVRIVIDHGGMVDKFVGDAVHAFFNMPLDLPGHPEKTVACAIAIQAWTEAWRREGLAAEFRFGRTRIGIETGPAVVGDIGIRAKLDYTAHGDTVNAAARFEAANKEIGSAICVGPGTASRCPPALLRPTGEVRLRGFEGAAQTFEPWPVDADAVWRARYLKALGPGGTKPDGCAALLAELASERPDDAVIRGLIHRLGRDAGV